MVYSTLMSVSFIWNNGIITLYKMEDPVAFSAQKERNQKRREESPTLWLCFLFWATTFLFQQCAKGKAQKIEKDKMLSSRKLFTAQKKQFLGNDHKMIKPIKLN